MTRLLTGNPVLFFHFTFALAISPCSYFCETSISWTSTVDHRTASPSPAAPGVVET